jgi:hypothetical protein
MMVSLYNGYPLFYWDSAAYINSGWKEFVPVDRPITYGLFLKHVSGERSLWHVVTVQNLVMSFLLFQVCAGFFHGRKAGLIFLLLTSTLTFATGIGWFSNQVMPDIFTSALILSMFLLLFRRMGMLSTVAAGTIFVFALAVHFSHLLIGSVLAGMALLYWVVGFSARFRTRERIPGARLVTVLLLTLAGWLSIPSLNYLYEGRFVLSKGSKIFLLAHFVENGILRQFLDENCGNSYYRDLKLCQCRDELPTDLSTFLWTKDGPFEKMGTWEEREKEAGEIVYAIMTSHYFSMNLKRSAYYTGIQLLRNDIGEGLLKFREGTEPYGQVSWRLPYQLNYYLNARQNCYELDKTVFRDLNRVNTVVNMLSLLALIFIFTTGIYRAAGSGSLSFLCFVMLAILVNAAIMVNFNAPTHRYQSRVSWMLTMALVLFLLQNRRELKAAWNRWLSDNPSA